MKNLIFLIVSILIFNKAFSQIVDSSFGTNGIVVTDLTLNVDALHAMKLQPDGKIIATGFSNNKLTLVRYKPNGLLDAAFGINGIAATNFSCNFSSPYEVSLLPDGKMLLLCANASSMLLTRHNANGSLDSSFGENGIANISQAVPGAYCSGMSAVADNKIIVAGSISYDSIFLIKYNADGHIDVSFGNQGYVKTRMPEGYSNIIAEDFCVQTNGDIFFAGNVGNETTGYADFFLCKINANGTLNQGFGNAGFKVTDVDGAFVNDYLGSIEPGPAGKLLLSGASNTNFILAMYNIDGTLDTAFGTKGITRVNVGGIYRKCADMVIEPNGKIVLAGYIGDDFGSVRINVNGVIDSSYGTNGIFRIDFGNSYDYSNVIIRQPDDKFVMGGWTSFFCADRAFALIRFSASSTALYWTGNVSDVWENPLNWNPNKIPDAGSRVIIPSVVPRFPKVSVSAEINSIQLKPGSMVNCSSGVVLKVNGRN
jgi:uncharacterized delta-60 repeat protein